MRIQARFPRLAAPALLSLALGACGDDGAGDGTETDSVHETTSGGASADSTTAPSTADDSGSESSAGEADYGACMRFPTNPVIGHVFVADGAEAEACDGDLEPCAGAPVGEWTLASSCGAVTHMPSNPFLEWCPGGDFLAQTPVQTGKLSIEPDGSFELVARATYDYVFAAAISCLGAFDCGPEAEGIIAEITGGSVSCEGQILACSCTVKDAILESHTSTGARAADDRPLLVADDGSFHAFCASDGQVATWSLLVPPIYAGSCESDDECEPANDNQIAVCMR